MGELARNFISQFHNLSGDTVKEKHHSLFRLCHQHSLLTENQQGLEFIVENLKPTNHLEKILRVDFLIYFRRFNELFDNFKNGDDVTLSKLSRQEWFFQNLYKDIDGHKFVSDVLPTMSHSLKMKVLKKLPVDEKLADEIFDALHKRYGIFLSTVFLPKCTSNKILETMKNHPIKLTVAQLQIIYNKNPDLIPVYLEERTKLEGNCTFMNNNPIFIFIAQKNPDMFASLFNKYQFLTKLGHRTTKRYIVSQKSNVLSKPEAYLDILNQSSTIRKLGSEIKDLLFKQSPRTFERYSNEILKYYPKNQQFNIYKSSYNTIYHQKFGTNIDAISEDILKMMSDPQEREKIAKLKLEKEENEIYLKYVTSDYCLKEFMEKLSHMPSKERFKFVEIATYCCILNNDLASLLKVCELVSVRFKNDGTTIRELFISLLTDNENIMDKLNEQHWKYIMDIVATANAKNEWIYKENLLRAKYIEYLIKNDKSIKETIVKYSDWLNMVDDPRTWNNQKLLKNILIALIEIGLPKPDPDDEKAAARYDCRLASACKDYNLKNPKETIDIFQNERIINSVEQFLEIETSPYGTILSGVEYMICRKSSSEQLKELKNLYFKAFKSFGQMSGLMWFLKREPTTLQDNFDHFLNNFIQRWGMNPKRLWRFIKKCTYLQLDKRTVEFCKLKLKEEGYKHKEKLVRPLTILSDPASHLEFIKPYIPVDAKVDLNDDELSDLYAIQSKLARLLLLLDSPAAVLPVALQFCKGDYLQFGLSPLYSCMYKLPENQTKLIIDQLNETNAVSVKKHGMNLTCAICDVDAAYSSLKHASVPSLRPTLKYFVKNPSQTLWELVETKICNMEKNDLQIIKWAMEINIPFEYRRKYFQVVWNALEKYESKELKKMLIARIDIESIRHFQPEFAYEVLRSIIFKFDEANDFIANLLIHLTDSEKYSVLSKILTDFKENCWNCKEMQRDSRRKLNKLVESIFTNYLSSKESDKAFVSKISTLLESIFSISEIFQEYVLVSSMAFKDQTPENCCKILIDLNRRFNKIYGPFAVNLFANTLKKHVFHHIFNDDSKKIRLCHCLYKSRESVSDYLLTIMLLPENEPKDVKHFTLYEEIVAELKQGNVNDKIVQLQFASYLKSC